MNRPATIVFLGLIATLALPGCASLVRTQYQRPDVELPAAWNQSGEKASLPVQDSWWKGFDDPALNRLILEALQRNNDLAAAALRVRQAMLQAELAGSAQLPSLNVDGSASYSRDLRRKTRETKTFGATIFTNYEADIWGRLASEHDAARWVAQATEEERAGAALTLTGTTATFYWQIGYLNQRVALSSASIEYARQTLELVRVQKAAGAVTSLEILEAERNLANQEASHTLLIQQRVEARNGLAILFDQPPKAMKAAEPNSLESIHIPDVAAGLPANLLARRPDVRAAEARLRTTLSSADATRASFYPTFKLSGSLGRSSEELSRLISNPIGTVAADLALPFVQWRDMRRTIKISEAEYEQAVHTFRQTLYTALAEVENSLSARQQYRIQSDQLEKTLDAARQAEELYKIRYQAGGSPLKSWLDAQESRRQAEINLAENRFNQLLTHVALVKALGGTPGEAESADGAQPSQPRAQAQE